MDVATLRDWVIIVYGILGILALLVVIVATYLIARAVLGLIRALRETVDGQVNPTIGAVRETAESIQRRASFMLDQAVRPIIKTYATVSGIRRGFAVFSGLRRRSRR